MLRLGLWLCLAASASASVSRVKRIVRVGEATGKAGAVRQSKKAGENFMFGTNLQKLLQQQVSSQYITIVHVHYIFFWGLFTFFCLESADVRV